MSDWISQNSRVLKRVCVCVISELRYRMKENERDNSVRLTLV